MFFVVVVVVLFCIVWYHKISINCYTRIFYYLFPFLNRIVAFVRFYCHSIHFVFVTHIYNILFVLLRMYVDSLSVYFLKENIKKYMK